LILPIYLSAPGFNYAAMTSYETFCFLQHVRWTGFFPEQEGSAVERKEKVKGKAKGEVDDEEKADPADKGKKKKKQKTTLELELERELGVSFSLDLDRDTISGHHQQAPTSPASYDLHVDPPAARHSRHASSSSTSSSSSSSWLRRNPSSSGWAETFYFYGQNLPTVALLLPRAGLSLALLLQFSSPAVTTNSAFSFGNAGGGGWMRRDETFFKSDGSLSGYARGILFANAAWTAWRGLVLIASWYVSLFLSFE